MRKLFLILTITLSSSTFGQVATDSLPDFGEAPVIFSNNGRPYLNLDYQFDAGSRDWTTQQILNFFYSGFLDETMKRDLLASSDEMLNLGVMNSWQLDFVYKGHKQIKLIPIPKRSLYVFNRSYSSLNLSRDLMDLALFGNAQKAGMELSDLNIDYQSWFYSGLGFQFGFLVDTVPLSLGLSFIGVHNYQSIQAQVNRLYTATNGSYIDFEGNYNYLSTTGQSTIALEGLGLAFSLATEEQWFKHRISFKIQDFGFAFMSDLNQVRRDSSFRYTGIRIPRLLSGEEAFVEEQGDSIIGGLAGSKSVGNWQLLPFRLLVDYGYSWDRFERQSLGLSFDYIHIPGYHIKSQIYYQYHLEKLKLRSTVGYGGFRAWHLDMSARWTFAKYWQLNINWLNVPGLLLPDDFSGTGITLAVRYYL